MIFWLILVFSDRPPLDLKKTRGKIESCMGEVCFHFFYSHHKKVCPLKKQEFVIPNISRWTFIWRSCENGTASSSLRPTRPSTTQTGRRRCCELFSRRWNIFIFHVHMGLSLLFPTMITSDLLPSLFFHLRSERSADELAPTVSPEANEAGLSSGSRHQAIFSL